MIELSELTKNVLEIFEIETQEELSKSIYDAVMSDDIRKYEKFEILVQDLSVDWLQMIYQYWLADREKKKQDYTPKTLALIRYNNFERLCNVASDRKIIGNVYQNPELLEADND